MRQKMQLLISVSCSLVAGAWYLVQRAILQAKRGELTAPDAAAIQRSETHAKLESQRRPVSADEGRLFLRTQFEPRLVSGWRVLALRFEVHLPLRCREAHARHGVDDHAQAIP